MGILSYQILVIKEYKYTRSKHCPSMKVLIFCYLFFVKGRVRIAESRCGISKHATRGEWSLTLMIFSILGSVVTDLEWWI